MERKLLLIMLLIVVLTISTATNQTKASTNLTIVRMISEKSQVGPGDVNSTFKVAVVIENVVDLYGFDIQLNWTTNLIAYVSHTTTVPKTSYPAPNPPSPYEGALNPPIIPVKDIVDEADAIPDAEPGTMGWFAYASLGAPSGQTGNATVVVLTFNITSPPTSSPIKIHFIRIDLSNMAATPISYEAFDLTIPVVIEHTVTIDTTEYIVTTLSNSTVYNLQLHAPEPKITFNVTGDTGTKGFCNITIPKGLIWTEDSWTILIDGQPATEFSITEDEENTYIYIAYEHSEHEITIEGTNIVAEFNSMQIVLLAAEALTPIIILRKKSLKNKK